MFNERVVEATLDIAAAFKPNTAFYEALGAAGWEALRQTVDHIHRVAPEIPVILDAKRADIGSTNEGYVRAIFDEVGADAVTVHPYLGEHALRPFLDRPGVGVFVLARTSNPGAGEFQDLLVDGLPLYRQVARRVARAWSAQARLGLVVGATYTRELEEIRADVSPDVPILIPGVGAQGGDLHAAVRANLQAGSRAFVINVSRGNRRRCARRELRRRRPCGRAGPRRSDPPGRRLATGSPTGRSPISSSRSPAQLSRRMSSPGRRDQLESAADEHPSGTRDR